MQTINATQVRNEWSSTLDTVVREKPVMIKRTRDCMLLADTNFLMDLLTTYDFHATVFIEDDGSVTISLDEIDLVENALTEQDALNKLSSSSLEYAENFYDDFKYWARGNRKAHIPYVFKALILGDAKEIGGLIKCQHGGN